MKSVWSSILKKRQIALLSALAIGIPAIASTNASAAAGTDVMEPAIPKQPITVQQADPAIAALVPAEIAKTGKLRVATVATFPPNEFKDPDGNSVGVHIDMGRALGQLMGVKVDFILTTFDGIIPGLKAKRYDMAMGSAAITKARLGVVDFVSDLKDGTMFMVAEGDKAVFKSDLDLCGRTLGVAKGSSQVALADEVAGKCKSAGKSELVVRTYPSQLESALALSSGRINTIIGVGEPLQYIAHGNPGKFRVTGQDVFPADIEGNMVPKGSALSKALVAAQNKLIENGTYKEILDKWGVASAAIAKSEINPQPRR